MKDSSLVSGRWRIMQQTTLQQDCFPTIFQRLANPAMSLMPCSAVMCYCGLWRRIDTNRSPVTMVKLQRLDTRPATWPKVQLVQGKDCSASSSVQHLQGDVTHRETAPIGRHSGMNAFHVNMAMTRKNNLSHPTAIIPWSTFMSAGMPNRYVRTGTSNEPEARMRSVTWTSGFCTRKIFSMLKGR